MSVVLLESKRNGETSWVAVRNRRSLLVQGMEVGDRLDITFKGAKMEILVLEDGLLPIPPGADAVKVVHTETSGSKVSVDLV